MFLSRKSREAKRALKDAHEKALAVAQKVYDQHRHQETVITEGEGPGYSFVSAASPEREAWDAYFYKMRVMGHSAWGTKKLFDRQLKTK